MGKEMNTFFMLCLRIENWILRWSVVSLERRLLTLELSLQIPRKLRLSGCFLPFFSPIFHCDYRSLSLTYVSPPPGGGNRNDDVLREDLKTSENVIFIKVQDQVLNEYFDRYWRIDFSVLPAGFSFPLHSGMLWDGHVQIDEPFVRHKDVVSLGKNGGNNGASSRTVTDLVTFNANYNVWQDSWCS